MSYIARTLAVAAALIAASTAITQAAEIRIAEQFSMGYLQFNVMKRDGLIEKHARERGVEDLTVTWQRFNGPSAMNEALLSNSTDIVSGGVPGLLTLWSRTRGTPHEVRGISALSSQPFLLNTNREDVRTIEDFSPQDRIAVPSVKVSVQAVALQMAAAQLFGEENYDQLDGMTVSMSPPDATIALLNRSADVTGHFAVPPFQYQQLEQDGIHTVLSSFDVMGPHSFTVAWTSARFRDANPEIYAAFVDALAEATEIVKNDPEETARTWIADTNSNLDPAFVTSVLTGPDVTWTMTPQNTMTFATFMNRVGTIPEAPESWQDIFFPEIAELEGS